MSQSKIKNNRVPQRIKKRSNFTNKEKIAQIQINAEIYSKNQQDKDGKNIIQNTLECFCKKIIRMKEQALQKATQMIGLLYEEKKHLQKELNNLKAELIQKEIIIKAFQYRLQSQTNRQLLYSPHINNESPLSKDKESVVVNDIFFSFSQPKSKQLQCKSTFDRSTMQIKPGFTISKQFQPWQNKQNIIQNLAEVISRQQASINQLRQINQLVRKQFQLSLNLQKQFESSNFQFSNDLFQGQDQENWTSEGKLTTHQSENKIQGSYDLISKYQNIIFRFRQYSAYLKANLCEATNFISKVGIFLKDIANLSEHNFAQLITILINFKSNINPMKQIFQQNKELHLIINQLIKNIDVIKANIKIK